MKSFALPARFAMFTLVIALWTMLYRRDIEPPNGLHNTQPVMAFQFAETDQDIQRLFVDRSQNLAVDFIDKMRYLTWLDFAFILFYSLFTITFAQKAGQMSPSIWSQAALFIAPVIGLCDILENIQLLRILNAVQNNMHATFKPELYWLSMATWVKWESTSILFLLMIPFLWQGGYLSKLIAALSMVVFITGLIALSRRLSTGDSISSAQTFASLVLLLFILFVFYTITKSIVKKQLTWL